MGLSISETLYHWMKGRRIIAAVAKRMGVPYTTLVSELNSRRHQAKLGADELVPLFEAIRKINYGDELDGVIDRWITDLRGHRRREVTRGRFEDQLLEVVGKIGALSRTAARMNGSSSSRELVQMATMIRAQILPALCKLEDIIDHRLEQSRGSIADSEGEVLPQ